MPEPVSLTAPVVVPGRWETSLSHTLYPGCRNCGAKHPLAMKPIPLDATACPKCAEPVQPPSKTVIVPTRPSLSVYLANACNAAARWLLSLKKRH